MGPALDKYCMCLFPYIVILLLQSFLDNKAKAWNNDCIMLYSFDLAKQL